MTDAFARWCLRQRWCFITWSPAYDGGTFLIYFFRKEYGAGSFPGVVHKPWMN